MKTIKKISVLFFALIFMLNFTAIGNFAEIIDDDDDTIQNPPIVNTSGSLQIYSFNASNWTANSNGNILSVVIRNTTPNMVSFVTVNASVSTKDSAYFRFNNNTNNASYVIFPGHMDLPYGVNMDVAPSTPNGTYTVNFNVTWINADGTQSSASKSVDVIVSNNNDNASIVIKDVKVSANPVIAGDNFRLSFTVVNPYNFTLKNLGVTLDGLSVRGISDTVADRVLKVPTLNAYGTKTFDIELNASEYMEEDLAQLVIKVLGFDDFNAEYSAEKDVYINLSKTNKFSSDSPRIIIDSYSMTPSWAQPGVAVTITLNLKNIGYSVASNIRVGISGFDSSIMSLNEVLSEKSVGGLMGQGTTTVTFQARLSKNLIQDVKQAIDVSFAFEDLNGRKYTDNNNIYIESKAPVKPDESVASYGKPRIIVESFSTDVEKIIAGEPFELTFVLKNTSKEIGLKNIKLSISSNAGGSTGGEVYLPVNASNTIFVEKIDKDGTIECKMNIQAAKSVETKIYPLVLNLEYEDDKNIPYSGSESIGLSVTQPVKIDVTNLYAPEMMSPGEMQGISFNYSNKGRSAIYFLSVDVQGALRLADGKMDIGSIPSGYSDYFDGTLIAEDGFSGESDCKIVFAFEDASGNEMTYEYPFKVNIMSGGDFPAFNPDGMGSDGEIIIGKPGIDNGWIEDGMIVDGSFVDGEEDTGFSFSGWILYAAIGAGAVILLIILIIIITVIRKGIKRRREAELVEDDD